jgi:hypothetical protein
MDTRTRAALIAPKNLTAEAVVECDGHQAGEGGLSNSGNVDPKEAEELKAQKEANAMWDSLMSKKNDRSPTSNSSDEASDANAGFSAGTRPHGQETFSSQAALGLVSTKNEMRKWRALYTSINRLLPQPPTLALSSDTPQHRKPRFSLPLHQLRCIARIKLRHRQRLILKARVAAKSEHCPCAKDSHRGSGRGRVESSHPGS